MLVIRFNKTTGVVIVGNLSWGADPTGGAGNCSPGCPGSAVDLAAKTLTLTGVVFSATNGNTITISGELTWE